MSFSEIATLAYQTVNKKIEQEALEGKTDTLDVVHEIVLHLQTSARETGWLREWYKKRGIEMP